MTVLLTFLLLLFGEIVPKIYSAQHALAFSRFAAPKLQILNKVFWPLSQLLIRSKVITKRLQASDADMLTVDDLEKAMELTDKKDIAEESNMLKGIIRFGGEMAKEILTRLRFDKKTINRVSFLVSHHDFEPPETKLQLKKKMKVLTAEDVRTLLIIKKSDRGALSESFRDISKESQQVVIWLKEIEENNECVTISQLKINGNDLINLGFKNEEIGQKLDYLLDCVVKEKLQNNKHELLGFLS